MAEVNTNTCACCVVAICVGLRGTIRSQLNYIISKCGDFYSHFENRVLLKKVLGSLAGVAHFIITGNERTQINRVCYFHFFGVFLAFKGSNYSEFIFTATVERLPVYDSADYTV